MRLELGNASAKQGTYTEYDAEDHTADELRSLAEARGVSTDGTKADIAARLSSLVEFSSLEGDRVTVVEFPEGTSIAEAFTTLTGGNGVWANHSDGAPTWVACESPGLEALVAEHYGCSQGNPEAD